MLINPHKVLFQTGLVGRLVETLNEYVSGTEWGLILCDIYFSKNPCVELVSKLDTRFEIRFVDSSRELDTDTIDELRDNLLRDRGPRLKLVVALGGGSTLDCGKAVSNLWTNGGKSSDYQGWDLVRVPGVYKIGVPTLPGTGAEASRTCVLINHKTQAKLGMNSDFSVFDELFIDPTFSGTVPREQLFYTAMDTYIHCIESLSGHYRSPLGDIYSESALALVRSAFNHKDFSSERARYDLSLASYMGGLAIGASFVGLVHPLSAGLSVVFGIPHCRANCIAMLAMEEFYPAPYAEFIEMVFKSGMKISGELFCLDDREVHKRLYEAVIVHEKPLSNALGPRFRNVLTEQKIASLYETMELKLAQQ